MKRVVVTGIGVVSCLGNNQGEVYNSLINAKSGITFSEEYKEYNLKSHVHGKPNIKLEDHVDRKFIRFMGPGSAYNYISMNEAVKDSGLDDKDISNINSLPEFEIINISEPNLANYVSKNISDVPNYEDIKMVKKITPKQGRVVVFDGMTWHSSTQPTKGPRCIINFDMV